MILYTIGHGYDSTEQFNQRLMSNRIAEIADVRSFPGSRRSPHSNREAMPDWLVATYNHWLDLGGRRKPPKQRVPEDRWWENESFANYAAHTRTEDFQLSYEIVMARAEGHNVAIMCGEPCWWRCHRRMISDLAVHDGIEVQHILPNGKLQRHEMSGWLKVGSAK